MTKILQQEDEDEFPELDSAHLEANVISFAENHNAFGEKAVPDIKSTQDLGEIPKKRTLKVWNPQVTASFLTDFRLKGMLMILVGLPAKI